MQLHAADSIEAPQKKFLAEGAISGTGDPECSESEDDDEILVPKKKKRAKVKHMSFIVVQSVIVANVCAVFELLWEGIFTAMQTMDPSM